MAYKWKGDITNEEHFRENPFCKHLRQIGLPEPRIRVVDTLAGADENYRFQPEELKTLTDLPEHVLEEQCKALLKEGFLVLDAKGYGLNYQNSQVIEYGKTVFRLAAENIRKKRTGDA